MKPRDRAFFQGYEVGLFGGGAYRNPHTKAPLRKCWEIGRQNGLANWRGRRDVAAERAPAPRA